ncbi:MAG: hypothetical protein GY910_09405 [bacterium]|nr:hypothetical protein [Deltaproteobacteria bacterium]MCP4905185.1 hypothetical protein [bacterium]
MSALTLMIAWLASVSVTLIGCALFERNARLVARPGRPELNPPRALWGGQPERPPAHAMSARALAGFARIVRRPLRVADHRPGLRLLGRLGTCFSLAFVLAMLPFFGTWGGGPMDAPLLLLDLRHGLSAIGFLLLLTSFARIAVGLSERNAWSRIGSAGQASRSIAALALLILVLAPLVVASGSLRLHDIVLGQQLPIAPIGWLLETFDGPFFQILRAWPIPAWNVFTQPLTAILFVPAMALLLGSPRIDDPTRGSLAAAGVGLDAAPMDLYWSRLDARLSFALAAGLFVTLFLGAGSIPFLEPEEFVSGLAPFLGEVLPKLMVLGLHLVTFLAKSLCVLAAVARLKRVAAVGRVDRALRLATRRLLPLAWANLLLVAASTLWFAEFIGSSG